jgi:hypothetical protein
VAEAVQPKECDMLLSALCGVSRLRQARQVIPRCPLAAGIPSHRPHGTAEQFQAASSRKQTRTSHQWLLDWDCRQRVWPWCESPVRSQAAAEVRAAAREAPQASAKVSCQPVPLALLNEEQHASRCTPGRVFEPSWSSTGTKTVWPESRGSSRGWRRMRNLVNLLGVIFVKV